MQDREWAGYVGVLFVDRAVIQELTGSKEQRFIERVSLKGQFIEVKWQGGHTSALTWLQIREKGELDHLPVPTCAFVNERTAIGLILHSTTPRADLAYREPHSIIRRIGLLTPAGLERQ